MTVHSALDRIDKLSPERQEVLATRLSPASFGQQRLWFLDQLQPGNPAYHIFSAVRLLGSLDADALERSFAAVVERHSVLRTSFPMLGRHLVQLVHPAGTFALDRVNLESVPAARREQELARLAKRAFERPFDLRAGPLLRVRLIRLEEHSHAVLMTLHHSVFDGWSRGIFLSEIAAGYAAALKGSSLPLPPLALQYGDYARWQRRLLAGSVLEDHLNFWRQRLRDAPTLLELPVDRLRRRTAAPVGAQIDFELPPPLCDAIRQHCRRRGVTPFMLMLAAFKVLLFRCTGATDISVGTPVAGRGRPEFERLIGFFVNTVVLRSNLSPELPFDAFLEQVRHVSLESFAHQDLPFEKLVDELRPAREVGITPLFQVMFSLQNASVEGLSFPGLTLAPMDFASTAAQFDLSLNLTDTGATVVGTVEYNGELFEASSIRRLRDRYLCLMQNLCAAPDVPIGECALMEPAERTELIGEWALPIPLSLTSESGAQTGAGRGDPRVPLHRLFEQQVVRRPDAPALIMAEDGGTLTYAALNRLAERFAHALRRAGIEPESLVCLMLPRSPELLAGLLGILKAGAACVPLDLACPDERLARIVRDARAALVLSNDVLAPRAKDWGIPCLSIAAALEATAEEPLTPLAAHPEQLAYVIYTSGSSGLSKGVGVPHGAVSLHVQAWCEQLALTPEDRVLQFASHGFDVAMEQVFSAFAAGACLVMREDVLWDPPTFSTRLQRHGVTVADLPAAYWSTLVRSIEGPWPERLRLVSVGGEVMPVDAWERWRASDMAAIPLLNAYGPTESVITCAVSVLDTELTAEMRRGGVPIGRSFGEHRLYVLDPRLQPVAKGVVGELHVGGYSLARGYLGQPGATAERFVPDPFGPSPGGRIYRTGDQVRWLEEGELEFLGRLDGQVKSRGFRIELGEVERVLSSHPAVAESAVVARNELGTGRLVAYLIPIDEERPEPAAFRRYLAQELPEHMMPAAFVWLDTLPLTSNGKLDRRALPDPTLGALEGLPASGEPNNDREQALLQVWRDVLGLRQIGTHDNFFDLGGDSILSIQVVTRARRSGIRLTPRLVFQHQTIASLAAASEAVVIDAEQDPVHGDIPAMPIQHWFFELGLRNPHRWNQALMLKGEGRLDSDHLRQVLGGLVAHHDALRARFEPGSGVWRQHIPAGSDPAEAFAFTSHALEPMSPEQERREIEARAEVLQAGFSLGEGPLFGAAYITLPGGRGWRLAVAAHHLVVDGVSWRILLDDIQQGYRQLLAGESLDFGPKTTSFRAWSERMHIRVASEALAAEAAYWQELYRESPVALPLDRQGVNTERSVRTVDVQLEAEDTEHLLHTVLRNFKTRIEEVLLAAVASALGEWADRDGGILVDLEGHGREPLFDDVDLSRTVGWFTTQYPVLLRPPRLGARGSELLRTVKESVRGLPHNGIGYGLLRYLPRSPIHGLLAAMPAAQVAFNYLGQLDRVLEADSLFVVAQESTGPLRDYGERRSHALEIVGSISGGRLLMRWQYSTELHEERTVVNAAETFKKRLLEFVGGLSDDESAAFTPSDFSKARVSQRQLDKLLGRIARAGTE